MTDRLTITGRYNGSSGSANGGYTCGVLARHVSAEEVEVTLLAPPPLERAEAAGHERWVANHPLPTCFVCGPERAPGDGLRIFPLALPSHDGMFGARWLPDESLASPDGCVRPEYVWAALDCPTSAPVANFGAGPPVVLARLTARLGCSVRAGEEHSIVSWPLARDGLKRGGGRAVRLGGPAPVRLEGAVDRAA